MTGFYERVGTRLPTAPFEASSDFELIGAFTANAGTDVLTSVANHQQVAQEVVFFTTTGTLPAPLIPNHLYRVLANALTLTDFQVSDNDTWTPPPPFPPAIDITDTGTGAHFLWIRQFVQQPVWVVDLPGDWLGTSVPGNSTWNFFRISDRGRFTSGGTLPSPLVAGTDYFVQSIGVITGPWQVFKVALGGSGNPPVDITSAGTGNHIMHSIHPNQDAGSDGVLGDFVDESYYLMSGETIIVTVGGGGGAAGAGGEPITIELPRPTIKVRDPELASLLRRARRAARTIENLTIVGASGDPESGFAISD